MTETGKNVTTFKVGDRVGVGVLVGSCKTCESCQQDLENYCPQVIFTYNSTDHDGTKTYGGYSNLVVVNQRYVLRFPDNLPPDSGAPLLCAGITVYSPMKYYGMTEPGKHLGVAGLGGLGHVAVKLGKAFGLKVTVISGSPNKEAEAIERLGADAFLLSSDPAKIKVLTISLKRTFFWNLVPQIVYLNEENNVCTLLDMIVLPIFLGSKPPDNKFSLSFWIKALMYNWVVQW